MRDDRGESVENVAHRAPGVSAKHLAEIERGFHAPSIVTAKRIADALDVPFADLVKEL